MRDKSESAIGSRGDAITEAAHALISAVRVVEHVERARASSTELTLEVELASGVTETWTITIKRRANA